jgi:hypothetical protein
MISHVQIDFHTGHPTSEENGPVTVFFFSVQGNWTYAPVDPDTYFIAIVMSQRRSFDC